MPVASRLTFARLILEVRRRAGGKPLHPGSMPQILADLRDLAGGKDEPEAEVLREILGALLGVHRDLELEGRALDALTPETVLRLDAVLAALLDGTMQPDELRAALRRALVRAAS
jgi:hypothetical protein